MILDLLSDLHLLSDFSFFSSFSKHLLNTYSVQDVVFGITRGLKKKKDIIPSKEL